MNTCNIEPCASTKLLARGMCNKHYKRVYRHGDAAYRKKAANGECKHPVYSTYVNMKTRYYNPANPAYVYYGAKGVKVCDRWLGHNGFRNFLEDMGERAYGLTLERIDSSGDYEPANCKWGTTSEQAKNRGMFKNNTSGFKGVAKRNGRWAAQIKKDYKTIWLGTFDSRNDALAARKQAEVLV